MTQFPCLATKPQISLLFPSGNAVWRKYLLLSLFLLQYRNQRGEHMFTATDKSFKGLSAACSLKWRLSKKACVTEHGKDFRISSEIYILLLNSASVWLLSNTNQVIWVSLNTYTNISAPFFPKSDNSMNK